MSKLPICASCVGIEFDEPILSSDTKLPKWLKNINYVKNFVKHQTQFRVTNKKKDRFKVTLHVSKEYANKYVLYWAAKKTKNEYEIVNAKKAYDDFSNSGVARVKPDGKVDLYIECPQNYRTTIAGKIEEDIFYRHVHFCFQKSAKKWDEKHIYTKVVCCNVSYTDDGILFDTLSKKEFRKKHIPGSFHLDATMVKQMSRSQLRSFFLKIIKSNSHEQKYATILENLKSDKLKWYAIPIILYCQNENCHASDACLHELYKKQVVNVNIYRGGMDEFSKH